MCKRFYMRRMERSKKGIHDDELQGQSPIRWGTETYCSSALFLDIINDATASPCIGIVSLIPIPKAAPFGNSRNGGIGSTQLVKHFICQTGLIHVKRHAVLTTT